MLALPGGTVTFLFTDIEGSTTLWEQHPEAMRAALALHDRLLRQTIESNNGVVFKTVGDAFCAVFADALDALKAALDAHLILQEQSWQETGPLRVRMGLHTGEAERRDGDYFGPTLNRVARLQAIGHGQQTLLSQTTYQRVQHDLPPHVTLLDRGLHGLKDLLAPEHVWQLLYPSLPSAFPPLKSLEYLPTNLPRQMTSFIGREREIGEVKQKLASTPLLTLFGPGGAGKTRLALQVGADSLDRYPDGVWLVELAALSQPDLIPQTIAMALGLREEAGDSLWRTVQRYLRNRHILMILDNCEHLLTACAHLADDLLRACPHVRILATSREGLGIAGEQIYRLASLTLPDPTHAMTPEDMGRGEAVRLFIERARAVRSDFTMTLHNAPSVAQLCIQLDGIPLALELAAARVRVLPVEQIEARLNDRFRLLTGGSRTALPRQQTLRALMEWSHDLLSEPERVLLRRLSVFVGGWTLEAAEAVCAEAESAPQGSEWAHSPSSVSLVPEDVLDLLTNLVDKSLVVYQDQEDEGRYRFLETVRQYAWERLQEIGEVEQIQRRHLAYFLRFTEVASAKLVGPEQTRWMRLLKADHDNIRTALTWCEAQDDGAEAGLKLTAALWRFWEVGSYWQEGLARYRTALAHPGAAAQTPIRATALQGAGAMARNQANYEMARRLFEEALHIRTAMGDRLGMALAFNNLGSLDWRQGDTGKAKERYEASLAIRREYQDRRGMAACLLNLGALSQDAGENEAAASFYAESLILWREIGDQGNLTILLTNLGNLAMSRQEYPQARDYYEEGLVIARATEDRYAIALALVNLGSLLCVLHDFARSRVSLSECLSLCREIGEQRLVAYALEANARLAAAQQQYRRALRLWAAADRLRLEIGAPLTSYEQAEQGQQHDSCRTALGDELTAQYRAEGDALTREQAIAYALDHADTA
ncbi:MAG: adenylate/guanylate cyclase protein [Chthonomonadales bacterium]|nr:adenylate/guanylate cyclase protein [Chthonomonadales bacterium]